MNKYRVVKTRDGSFQIQKKSGFWEKWKKTDMPGGVDKFNKDHVISIAKWLHACEVENKAYRNRVVWKL